MRDLDYNDPESWVDGVIKPWTPVVASGEAGTQETGENSVFTGIIDGLGHKITGLTNICPAQAEDVTVTRTWTEGGEQKTQEFTFKAHDEIVNPRGFAFFDSLNANGTVRNLTVEYKTEIDKDHYTEYGIYTPFNLAWDNYGDESIALSDVHIQNSSIYIDASNIPPPASRATVCGLRRRCQVNEHRQQLGGRGYHIERHHDRVEGGRNCHVCGKRALQCVVQRGYIRCDGRGHLHQPEW